MSKKKKESSANPKDGYIDNSLARSGYDEESHPFDAYINDRGGPSRNGYTGQNHPNRYNLREETYSKSQSNYSNSQSNYSKSQSNQKSKNSFNNDDITGSGNGNGKGKGKSKKSRKLIIVLILLMAIALGIGLFIWLRDDDQEIKPVTTNPTKDVVLITSSAGFNDPTYKNIWTGIEAAQQKNNLTTGYKSVTKDTDKDIDAIIDEACREYRVVILCGQDVADNLLVKAQVYPQIKFILFEGIVNTDEGDTSTMDNILEVSFRVEEMSYLSGYLAAKVSSKYCYGFIGGKDDVARRTYYGYFAGIYSVNTGSEIKDGLFTPLHDGNRITMLANSLFSDSNAQTIIHSVGYQYEQIIASSARQNNKKIISVNAEGPSTGEEVLVTIKKKYNVVIENILEGYSNGTLGFGQKVIYGLQEETLELLRPESKEKITDSLWKEVEERKKKIIDGKLLVPGTKEEFESFESKYL